MKFRAWIDIFVSIIMLIISGYLLADSSAMSLDLRSNPNLNVAIELIRLFWGIVGIIYFLHYLYHGICLIRSATDKAGNGDSKTSQTKPRKKQHKRRRRKKSRKNNNQK